MRRVSKFIIGRLALILGVLTMFYSLDLLAVPSLNSNSLSSPSITSLSSVNKSISNSSSNSSIGDRSYFIPAIPQPPDHSKEISPQGKLNWNIYYRGLIR